MSNQVNQTHQSPPNGMTIYMAHKAQGLANYPHARVVNGMIYVSGISSRRFDDTWEGVEEHADGTWTLDIKAQTRAVITNIRDILHQAGVGLEALVDITVFLVNMKDYSGMNEVYNEYFTRQTGPARTTVAVAELPNPRLLVEMKAIAMLPPQPL